MISSENRGWNETSHNSEWGKGSRSRCSHKQGLEMKNTQILAYCNLKNQPAPSCCCCCCVHAALWHVWEWISLDKKWLRKQPGSCFFSSYNVCELYTIRHLETAVRKDEEIQADSNKRQKSPWIWPWRDRTFSSNIKRTDFIHFKCTDELNLSNRFLRACNRNYSHNRPWQHK